MEVPVVSRVHDLVASPVVSRSPVSPPAAAAPPAAPPARTPKKPQRVYKINEFTFLAVPDGMEINSFEFQRMVAETKRAQEVATQREIEDDLSPEFEEVASCPSHPDDADLDDTDNEEEEEEEPNEEDKAFLAPSDEEGSDSDGEDVDADVLIKDVLDLVDDASACSSEFMDAPDAPTESEASSSEDEAPRVILARRAREKALPRIAVGAKLLNIKVAGKKKSRLQKIGPKAEKRASSPVSVDSEPPSPSPALAAPRPAEVEAAKEAIAAASSAPAPAAVEMSDGEIRAELAILKEEAKAEERAEAPVVTPPTDLPASN